MFEADALCRTNKSTRGIEIYSWVRFYFNNIPGGILQLILCIIEGEDGLLNIASLITSLLSIAYTIQSEILTRFDVDERLKVSLYVIADILMRTLPWAYCLKVYGWNLKSFVAEENHFFWLSWCGMFFLKWLIGIFYISNRDHLCDDSVALTSYIFMPSTLWFSCAYMLALVSYGGAEREAGRWEYYSSIASSLGFLIYGLWKEWNLMWFLALFLPWNYVMLQTNHLIYLEASTNFHRHWVTVKGKKVQFGDFSSEVKWKSKLDVGVALGSDDEDLEDLAEAMETENVIDDQDMEGDVLPEDVKRVPSPKNATE